MVTMWIQEDLTARVSPREHLQVPHATADPKAERGQASTKDLDPGTLLSGEGFQPLQHGPVTQKRRCTGQRS